jgi:hypothetical protein
MNLVVARIATQPVIATATQNQVSTGVAELTGKVLVQDQ